MKEIINITLEFDSTYDIDAPTIEVFNNGQIVGSKITVDQPCQIQFNLDLESDSQHLLEIVRGNHTGAGQQICKFVKFIVDEIDITDILDYGKFYPVYPMPWYQEQLDQGITWPEYHERWRDWGWDGVWRLNYQSPFFRWLLKTI